LLKRRNVHANIVTENVARFILNDAKKIKIGVRIRYIITIELIQFFLLTAAHKGSAGSGRKLSFPGCRQLGGSESVEKSFLSRAVSCFRYLYFFGKYRKQAETGSIKKFKVGSDMAVIREFRIRREIVPITRRFLFPVFVHFRKIPETGGNRK
jgi:hypothetical protein